MGRRYKKAAETEEEKDEKTGTEIENVEARGSRGQLRRGRTGSSYFYLWDSRKDFSPVVSCTYLIIL